MNLHLWINIWWVSQNCDLELFHDSCGFWNAGNVHPITSTQPFNQEAEAAFGPEVRRAEIDADHAKVSWYEQLFQVWEGMLMVVLRVWGNGIIRGDHYRWNLQVNCQVEKSRMACALNRGHFIEVLQNNILLCLFNLWGKTDIDDMTSKWSLKNSHLRMDVQGGGAC